jgi:hypothetical protein
VLGIAGEQPEHHLEAAAAGAQQHVGESAAPGLELLRAGCGLGELGRYGGPWDAEEVLACGDPPCEVKVIECLW